MRSTWSYDNVFLPALPMSYLHNLEKSVTLWLTLYMFRKPPNKSSDFQVNIPIFHEAFGGSSHRSLRDTLVIS